MAVKIVEEGNLLDSECKYLVNVVNCIGSASTNSAKQFAEKYPKMYEEYKTLCKVGAYELGKIRVHQDNGKYIINFPTIKYPGQKSKMSDIIRCLQFMKQRMKYEYQYDNIPITVAMSAVGSDEGLNAEDILAEIEKCFKYTGWCNIDFYIAK